MFRNETMITGHTPDGVYKFLLLSGHWNIASAIKAGRRSKIMGDMEITHEVTDGSCGGRGGHDGRWKVDAKDKITCKALSKIFGKERRPED